MRNQKNLHSHQFVYSWFKLQYLRQTQERTSSMGRDQEGLRKKGIATQLHNWESVKMAKNGKRLNQRLWAQCSPQEDDD
jgi:hypothetical protein